MLTYDDQRHRAAIRAADEQGSFARSCRTAGTAIGLATWIISRDLPCLLAIDSETTAVPAGGLSIDARGLAFRHGLVETVIPLGQIRAWGRDSMSEGAEWQFEWEQDAGTSRSVALVPAVRNGDAGYAHAVMCAIVEATAEGEDKWAYSDMDRSIRYGDRRIAIEPKRISDEEVPSDDHELVIGHERIRIGDICAMEKVEQDCYHEYHIVVADGRYRRIAFGEYDR